jgi:hypothetical protein
MAARPGRRRARPRRGFDDGSRRGADLGRACAASRSPSGMGARHDSRHGKRRAVRNPHVVPCRHSHARARRLGVARRPDPNGPGPRRGRHRGADGDRARTRRPRGAGPRREEVERVAIPVRRAGVADAEVEMRRGRRPRPARADGAEPIPGRDPGAGAHRRGRQVQIRGVEPTVRRAHRNGQARRPRHPGEPHRPPCRGADRRTHPPRDVDPAVLAGRVGVGPVAIRRDDRAVERPQPAGGAGFRRHAGEAGERGGDETGDRSARWHSGDRTRFPRGRPRSRGVPSPKGALPLPAGRKRHSLSAR